MAFQRRQQPQRQQQQGQQEYDNTNKGILFQNGDKVEGDPNDRDYKGKINFICSHCGSEDERWLSGYDRQTKIGDALALYVGPPIEQQGGQQRRVDQTNNFQRQNAAPRPQQRSFPQQQAPRSRALPPTPRQRPSFDDTEDDIPYTP